MDARWETLLTTSRDLTYVFISGYTVYSAAESSYTLGTAGLLHLIMLLEEEEEWPYLHHLNRFTVSES